MYKVVISDLDGTLLNNQHQVSPHTRKVLKKWLLKALSLS